MVSYIDLPIYTRFALLTDSQINREESRLYRNNDEIRHILNKRFDNESLKLLKKYSFEDYKFNTKDIINLCKSFVHCISQIKKYVSLNCSSKKVEIIRLRSNLHRITMLFSDLDKLNELLNNVNGVNGWNYENMINSLINPYQNSMLSLVNFFIVNKFKHKEDDEDDEESLDFGGDIEINTTTNSEEDTKL